MSIQDIAGNLILNEFNKLIKQWVNVLSFSKKDVLDTTFANNLDLKFLSCNQTLKMLGL